MPIDWSDARRVLLVRLRSIGDAVLMSACVRALREYAPGVEIDVVLEDWVAPLFSADVNINEIIVTTRRATMLERLKLIWKLRRKKYDVVFNLHGGTTATFLTNASAARYRVGFKNYQYGFLHNVAARESREIWGKAEIHSVEQQLALLATVGVPVNENIETYLSVTNESRASVRRKLEARGIVENASCSKAKLAVLHPAAAFETKQWATENFARVAEYLYARGFSVVATATKKEAAVLQCLRAKSKVEVETFDDLSLPEVAALIKEADLFVGNDSGIAHIAAAVKTPLVVVFGSSNVTHWRPWLPNAQAAFEVVRENLPCQPCAGYTCKEFAEPQCIKRVSVKRVIEAIGRVLILENEKQATVSREPALDAYF